MIWPQSGGHSEDGEELGRHPRIFGTNKIDGRKDIEGAEGDVAEVAYGSRNNVEPGSKLGIGPEKAMRYSLFLGGIILAPSLCLSRVRPGRV